MPYEMIPMVKVPNFTLATNVKFRQSQKHDPEHRDFQPEIRLLLGKGKD